MSIYSFSAFFFKYVVTLSQEPRYNFSQREHDISVQILQAENFSLFPINALTVYKPSSSKNSCKKIVFFWYFLLESLAEFFREPEVQYVSKISFTFFKTKSQQNQNKTATKSKQKRNKIKTKTQQNHDPD